MAGVGSAPSSGEMERGAQCAARIERCCARKSRNRGRQAGGSFACPAEREPGGGPGGDAFQRLFEKVGGRVELACARVATRVMEAAVGEEVARGAK